MKKLLFLLPACCLFFACAKEKKVNVERAFYYWKSGGSFYDPSKEKLNKFNVKKMYVKYFEVDYSEAMGNYPYEKSDFGGYSRDGIDTITVVPTVFVKNEIFQYNKEKDLDRLADNIVYLVKKFSKEKFEDKNVANEIQIDCDWTKGTRDKYFYLLKKIKALSKGEISCTLRLYPYKYPKIMGVPPVDKATLMCYNLIKPLSEKDKNSILDLKELKSYLNEERTYPVHLDIALPVFHWTQLYHDNQFSGLKDLNSTDLKSFTKPVRPLWYQVTKDTTINYDDYYRAGDVIKCEEVTANDLEKAIAIIRKNVVLDHDVTISLFHFDENTLNQYSDEEISGFYGSFSK